VVLFMVKPILTGRPRRTSEKVALVFILGLTAFKVVVNSERLALIELLVPFAVLVCTQRRRSLTIALAPLGGIAGMFVFFTGTEYLRSWVTYYAVKSDSLWGFAMERMFGYYVTAINNGAYIYNEANSYLFPIFTGEWFWHLPIPGLIQSLNRLVGVRSPNPLELKEMLYGLNIEFNNTSGIFAPLIDYGPILGVAIWIALGYISGRLYRLFAEARPLGLLLFPTWFVGVLEIPRIFYWGDNRYFPSLTVTIAIAVMLALTRSRQFRPPSPQRFHPQDIPAPRPV
jgi:hypothetical protein